MTPMIGSCRTAEIIASGYRATSSCVFRIRRRSTLSPNSTVTSTASCFIHFSHSARVVCAGVMGFFSGHECDMAPSYGDIFTGGLSSDSSFANASPDDLKFSAYSTPLCRTFQQPFIASYLMRLFGSTAMSLLPFFGETGAELAQQLVQFLVHFASRLCSHDGLCGGARQHDDAGDLLRMCVTAGIREHRTFRYGVHRIGRRVVPTRRREFRFECSEIIGRCRLGRSRQQIEKR